jgi:hypothetical protein
LLEETQSESAVQLVLHAVALAQISPPGQGPGVPALQVPEPLQVDPGVNVEPEQEAVPHEVPLAG